MALWRPFWISKAWFKLQWNLDNSKSKGPNSFVWITETLNNWGLKCIHISKLGLQNDFELLRILNYWSLNYRGSTVFFLYTSTWGYFISFNLIRLVVCEKMSKTNFQYGGCGGHLGFPIDKLLAHFDPEIVLLLQRKFRLKSTKVLGRNVENWWSRWRLWQPSWIFDRHISFGHCMSTRRPDAPHQLSFNWIIVFRGDVQHEFSTFFPYKCMGKQIWPCRKRSNINVGLSF